MFSTWETYILQLTQMRWKIQKGLNLVFLQILILKTNQKAVFFFIFIIIVYPQYYTLNWTFFEKFQRTLIDLIFFEEQLLLSANRLGFGDKPVGFKCRKACHRI